MMSIAATIMRIEEIGIIPVIRVASVDDARRAVDAIREGGIPIVEITMTVPGAPKIIGELAREYGEELLTGAGTVLNAKNAEACLDAGAQFLVSPGISIPVSEIAAKRGVLAIPGALTPTEVMRAMEMDAELIKIFPCGSAGGPKHIKALKAPFPQARLIPTGGVSLSNANEYFAAGAFALGAGADLVDVGALRKNGPQKIVEMARAFVKTVRVARMPTASY
jgi:2-dehydro-3-deoxyphosphogluconate aldolase/(4S)-4-hydroxy-2-oxoglutarate aldolase